MNKVMKVLKHIRDEQISHGEHGDQEYIRLCNEALDEFREIESDLVVAENILSKQYSSIDDFEMAKNAYFERF